MISTRTRRANKTVNFRAINDAALQHVDKVVRRWLPDGRRYGNEWVTKNPTRADKHAGSFKVNLRTGRWADFATGDGGGDLVSLAAFIFRLRQTEAARKIAEMLSITIGGGQS